MAPLVPTAGPTPFMPKAPPLPARMPPPTPMPKPPPLPTPRGICPIFTMRLGACRGFLGGLLHGILGTSKFPCSLL